MLFSSFEFLFLFLPVVFLAFRLLQMVASTRVLISFLLLASIVFYGWWKVEFLPLILGSILVNFLLGKVLAARRQSSASRWVLGCGVVMNLSFLVYFKYAHFLTTQLSSFGVPVIAQGILPLGISFFTFQQLTYLVDVYRGKEEENSFTTYALFVSFFPHLIAGPITHHGQILNQLRRLGSGFRSNINFASGLGVFAMGFCKKLLIADELGPVADAVFGAVHAGVALTVNDHWMGTLAYTLQLYFDFSGYSEMALGLGLMFGVRFPANFLSPYKSKSIIEFWRRWHMSLGWFLREYVYYPLGGSRKGPVRRHVNLFMVLLISGIWHGSGWTFIVWGIGHGLLLVANHWWRNHTDFRGKLYEFSCHFATLAAVIAGWIVFRSASIPDALAMFRGLFVTRGEVVSVVDNNHWIWIAVAGLVCLFLPNVIEIWSKYRPCLTLDKDLLRKSMWTARLNARWGLIIALLMYVGICRFSRVSPFLYFEF
jgi:D-alanyl-lipoteichoic acid acyltransferase DltB (MBOAT superfamily)